METKQEEVVGDGLIGSFFSTIYSAYKFIENAIYSDPYEIPEISPTTLDEVIRKTTPSPEENLRLNKVLESFRYESTTKFSHSIDRTVCVGGFQRRSNLKRENFINLVLFVNNGKCDSRISHMTWSNCDTCFNKSCDAILKQWVQDFRTDVLQKNGSENDVCIIGGVGVVEDDKNSDVLLSNQIKYYSARWNVTFLLTFVPSGQMFTDPSTISSFSMDTQKLLSPALADKRLQYLERFSNAGVLKSVLLLVKQWNKENSNGEGSPDLSEYFLEVLLLDVVQKIANTQATIPNIFVKFIQELLQMAKDSYNSIDPVLMDPVIPINLAEDVKNWAFIRAKCTVTLEKFGFKTRNIATSEKDQDEILEALAQIQSDKDLLESQSEEYKIEEDD